MKNHIFILLLVLCNLSLWTSCEDYVTSIDHLIDRIEDKRLNDESQIPFIINGIKAEFSDAHNNLVLNLSIISDELFYDVSVAQGAYGSFRRLDDGEISIYTNRVETIFSNVGQLRFYADDIIRRAREIEFTNSETKNEALFWGHFYGAIARYYYTCYFGLTENEGGGVIDNGPFIPSNEMYNLAVEKFQAALNYTDDQYHIRVINSLIARIYLFQADYNQAQVFAVQGLTEGDNPFQAKYNPDYPYYNIIWSEAGIGRTLAVVDWRFNDYVKIDSSEIARINIESFTGPNDSLYYRQVKYPNPDSPIDFISWQENDLMLAEIDLQAGNNISALTRVNRVRASHGVTLLESIDMESLINERDKELFLTGIRFVDQRRFDSEYNTWHLGPGTWRYLPIPESERNINPHIG